MLMIGVGCTHLLVLDHNFFLTEKVQELNIFGKETSLLILETYAFHNKSARSCVADPDDPLKTTDQTRRLGLIVGSLLCLLNYFIHLT